MRVWLSGASLTKDASTQRLPFPESAAEILPRLERELNELTRITTRHTGSDSGERLVLTLHDGKSIESVLLPRDGVCVSTQVGCAVGCTFCMTGTLGLERQLSVDELLAQVVVARRNQAIRRVVFMGMGEPAHNLANVLEAIHHLGTDGDIAHKNLVFSTVGDPKVFDELAANSVRPALALSLHTTDDARRRELVPRGPRAGPRELLESALDYADRVGHPLQLQWTLLRGINDTDEELERLIAWLRGRRVAVNFIPFNEVEGFDHERTSGDRAHEMTRALHANGIIAKLRLSAAQDVYGGCGQLRARSNS